jgi:hypothetical protein
VYACFCFALTREQQTHDHSAPSPYHVDQPTVVAFSKGFVVAISTHEREMQKEIHCLRVFETQLYALVYSKQLKKLAVWYVYQFLVKASIGTYLESS